MIIAPKKPKKVFITGIAGFIGFHLALFLKKRGDFVVGCDNFNSYYDPSLKRLRKKILQENDIDVIDCDIRESQCLEQVIIENHITHFVHLAAMAGVRYSMENPASYVDTNLDGFLKVLELIRKYPAIKLTYASSSSVYGLNTKIPFSEEDTTDHPACFYAATKKSNEHMAHCYHNMYGISVTGLRFFTVYGPYGRPDMAYFSFATAILNEKPVPLFNKGKMRRDFTYIDDIVKGITAAMDKEFSCEIFNLGNNKPEETLYLVKLLEEKIGKKARIENPPAPKGDVLITYADISKAKEKLGFYPEVSLEEGIERFVDWFLAYSNASSASARS